MNVLVTGAGGFIGQRLVSRLRRQGHHVRGIDLSRPSGWLGEGFRALDITDALSAGDLERAMEGVDVVFHLAAKVHALTEVAQDRAEYFRINTDGTRNVLEAAGRAGVRRFVFFSTVKAMGEGNADGGAPEPIDETSECVPGTPYGASKLRAEQLVLEGGHVAEAVVLRLCMVYGSCAKGNMLRMLRAVAANRFPPLPDFGNRRSMVHVDDVVSAAMLAATQAGAAGRTYIVCDDAPFSTRRTYDLMRAALGRPASRTAVPAWSLKALARVGDVLGRVRRRRVLFDRDALAKLQRSALYSNARICRELGFVPQWTLERALPQMVKELDLS